MSTTQTDPRPLERLVEWLDKPLLVLAVLTIVLFLLDLRGVITPGHSIWSYVLVFIDVLFLLDLMLKLWVFGASYMQTPWFLIDLISCLPILDAIATGVHPLRSTRFVRGFRILRILRGLRILRVIRSVPAYEQVVQENPETNEEKRLHRFMNLGLIGMTITVLILIVMLRKKIEHDFVRQVDLEIHDGLSLAVLRALGGKLTSPPDEDVFLVREAVVDGRSTTIYFDMERIEERSDEFEFFLILGMLLSMLFLMYIIAYHQLDVTQAQLRGLLNLALPKQVADRFALDPTSYNHKSRMPASILFMDFVGFTKTCEQLNSNPDLLSSHLESAMGRVVSELVRHDLIIDKFIGDAVMSFRGGPLVDGTLNEHAYRTVRAALDSMKALAALKDPFFHRVKIGGASAEDCLIGAFGTTSRLAYTILGDGVNLAARLEPASAQCGTRNLFCETTYRLCADCADLVWRRWGQIRVAGKIGPVNVYEVFDRGDLPDSNFVDTYHRALEAYERNAFQEAREFFVLADSMHPNGDRPSLGYIAWCDELLGGGTPEGWEPVLDTHK